MKEFWLFKRLNLSLRTEVIVNISLLMMAAILLIGFTTFKISEKNIVQERIRNGERVGHDLQAMVDFLSRDQRDFSMADPGTTRELREFVQIYTRQKDPYDLIVVNQASNVVASKRRELIGQPYFSEGLKNSMQSSQFKFEIKKSGGVLSTNYEKIILFAPLWIQGRVGGGIQWEIPTGDLMTNLWESRRIILISIVLDAIVLIVFGSLLLTRVLVKPVKGLVRLTQRISDGDFAEKIEVSSSNEIGKLIASFNRMIEKLGENQSSLESYLESLEASNKKLKEAQEEVIRTEKLASIGRFAAGVAHEVGNPLGAILGYTSILEKEGIDREEAKDYLQRIEKEIERINRIVRELLDFAKPSKFEIREVDVNKVVENTLSLLSYQKNFKNVETRISLQPNLPMVKGDEDQLSQVFLNIILNAIDAMPDRGVLNIRTMERHSEDLIGDRLQRLHPPRRKEDPAAANYSHLRKSDPLSALVTKYPKGIRQVTIEISDTGAGIAKEDLEKIFDPFFTTKFPDKGTGLGLSISLRIVESMGGEIRVESKVGKGSTFEVYLPAATHHE